MFKTQFSLLHSIRFIDYSRCKDTHFSPHINLCRGEYGKKAINIESVGTGTATFMGPI